VTAARLPTLFCRNPPSDLGRSNGRSDVRAERASPEATESAANQARTQQSTTSRNRLSNLEAPWTSRVSEAPDSVSQAGVVNCHCITGAMGGVRTPDKMG